MARQCKLKNTLSVTALVRLNKAFQEHSESILSANADIWEKPEYQQDAEFLRALLKQIKNNGGTKITPKDLKSEITIEDNSTTPVKQVERRTVRSYETDSPVLNYNGDTVQYNNMVRSFRNKTISMTITDLAHKQVKEPNAPLSNIGERTKFGTNLNKDIFNYKMDLIRTIAAFTRVTGIVVPANAKALFDLEQKVLESFFVKDRSDLKDNVRSSEAYLNAKDAYTILSNFDSFITKFAPYIKVKPGFGETESFTKYEYIGSNLNLRYTSFNDADEKANSSDNNTPDLVKTLLDFYTERDGEGNDLGIPISLPGFNQIMSVFKQWYRYASPEALTGLKGNAAIKGAVSLVANIARRNQGSMIAVWNRFVQAVNSHSSEIDWERCMPNIVRGVSYMLSPEGYLPEHVKNMMWKVVYDTEENISEAVSEYDGSISAKDLRDGYKSMQWAQINDTLRSTIRNYKYGNPEIWNRIRKEFGISFDENKSEGRFSITVKSNGKKQTVSFTRITDKGKVTAYKTTGSIDNETAKRIIERITDLLVPGDYIRSIDQVLKKVTPEYKKNALFDIYGNAIGVVIDAVMSPDEDAGFYWSKTATTQESLINLRKFNKAFGDLQTFMGITYRANISNNVKNNARNSVAKYGLTSMTQNIPELISIIEQKTQDRDDKEVFNPYREGNILYEEYVKKGHRSVFGQPKTRNDIKVGNTVKKARDLGVGEVTYLGIICDFFQQLVDSKEEGSRYLGFQNNAFSDKNTHFICQYSKDLRLTTALTDTIELLSKDIISTDGKKRQTAINKYLDRIYKDRMNSIRAIMFGIYSDYKAVYGDQIADAVNVKDKLDAVLLFLSQSGKSAKQLSSDFANKGIEYVPEYHFSDSAGSFNETIAAQVHLYSNPKRSEKFNDRMNLQLEETIADLKESNFEWGSMVDPVVTESIIQRIGNDWIDSLTGEILLTHPETGETNPLITAWFLNDVLLSNAYNEIVFGKSMYHPNKYAPSEEAGDYTEDENGNKIYSDVYYMHAEASRLSASYKRTVNAGATVHLFAPSKNGVSPEINIAVVKDFSADVWNMLGLHNAGLDSMDGSGLASPLQAIMENNSLPGTEVGMDKKTIFGDIDDKTGMAKLVKWAVYALTNDRRRMSILSDISAEELFEKMHNIPINSDPKHIRKFAANGISKHYDYAEHPIYRYDPNTNKHYKISRITQNGNSVSWTETEMIKDIRNNKWVDGTVTVAKNREINSLYDLDQVFGGAYCEELDNGAFKWSNQNNKIVVNIIGDSDNQRQIPDLKDKMVSYIINKSAIKVGASNINGSDIFKRGDKSKWLITKLNILFGGVQMDADHELNEAHVTEMSQMISALTQNGLAPEEVDKIYSEIGNVVLESMRTINWLLKDTTPSEETIKFLGKSLIDTFSTRQMDTIGLAQSYLLKAKTVLDAGGSDLNIPWSDPNIYGAFIANVASTINQKGIKRKYAGVAAVLVPSRGMIQYFRYGKNAEGQDVTYMADDLQKVLKSQGYNKPINEYIRGHVTYDLEKDKIIMEDGTEHPFMVKLNNPLDADMGNTITVIDAETGNIQEERVVLNNRNDYFRIRHSKNQNLIYFKNTVAPYDLRQSDTTFDIESINGIQKYSIYDLDSVIADHAICDGTSKFKKDLVFAELSDDTRHAIEYTLKRRISRSEVWSPEYAKEQIKLVRRVTKRNAKYLDEGKSLGYNTLFDDWLNIDRTFIYESDESNATSAELGSDEVQRIESLFARFNTLNEALDAYSDLSTVEKLALKIREDTLADNLSVAQMIRDFIALSKKEPNLTYSDLIRAFKYVDPEVTEELFAEAFAVTQEDVASIEESGIVGQNSNTRFAEIIMGKLNAEQFGLTQADSLSEILANGTDFFRRKINIDTKASSNIDPNQYSVILIGKDGEKIYIGLNDVHNQALDNDPEFKNGYRLFENRNNRIFYKGQELCDKLHKRFYTKNVDGERVNVILVNDLDELDEFMKTGLFTYQHYNYTPETTKTLFKHAYQNYFSEDILSRNLYFKVGGYKIDVDEENPIDFETTYNLLLEQAGSEAALRSVLDANNLSRKNEERDRRAAEMYASFKKQLQFVGARIPTQSMQSFMGMNLVGFSNSDVNEIYVPAVQTWLQGSDYKSMSYIL